MKKSKKEKQIVFDSQKDMPVTAMSLGSMLYNQTGTWRNIRPEIDAGRCIQCGICWKYCPDVSIDIVDEWPVVNYAYCKGCGICAEECPVKCIAMVEEEK